jgi:GT2 family glycosyltransferase
MSREGEARVVVSVVIVSYNVRRHLLATLRGLFASRDVALDVIVVDNASQDGSIDAVGESFPQVRLIPLDSNVGFAAANNIALRECRSEYVLVVNPDVIVDADAIRLLRDFLVDHPDAGGAGPHLTLPDGLPERAARRASPTPWVAAARLSGVSRLFPSSPRFARYNLGHIPANAVHEIDSGSGACMLFRREALEQVRCFDTDFFLYGEDLDLCLRIRAMGWRLYYVPMARAVHVKGASASQKPLRSVFEFHRAMWVFYTKHYAPRLPAAFHLLVWLAIWARWLVFATWFSAVLQWQLRRSHEATLVAELRIDEVAHDA